MEIPARELSWGSGTGMICPSSGSRCAMSAAKYPAARRFAIFFSVTVEATHLPPALEMTNCAEKTWTRALELERRGMDRKEESMGAKGSPYPLIKAAGILRLPTCLVNSLIPQAS